MISTLTWLSASMKTPKIDLWDLVESSWRPERGVVNGRWS